MSDESGQKNKRIHRLGAHWTEAEYKALKKMAIDKGLTASSLIRLVMLTYLARSNADETKPSNKG